MKPSGMDDSLAATLAAWRRHLHAHPELSLDERETAAFVCARLAELGIPHVAGVGGHGVVATLSRGRSNRSVGLRADMDALPITETSGLAHASTRPGVMHACGHDGHTASLLGAAALLAGDPGWTGTVQLLFQPAEEGFGGAQAMLEDGLLARFPMERIFAYHNWPGLAAGTVAVHDGPVMAGCARLSITLHGQAGHAGMPHLTRDPMLAAGHLLVALQSVVSRTVDPLESAVVSICMIDGGGAYNQIPSTVRLCGTVRAFKPAVREQVDAAIARVLGGIAATFGVTAELDLPAGIGATINHRAEAGLAAEAVQAAGLALRRDLPPAMTSEDFSCFLQQRPGAFLWIGNGPAAAGTDLHGPDYDFNDGILPVAATVLAGVARRALREGG
jgi:hippurate hydrolase